MRNYPAVSVLEPSFLAASMALFFFSSSIVCCKSLLSGYIMLSKKRALDQNDSITCNNNVMEIICNFITSLQSL